MTPPWHMIPITVNVKPPLNVKPTIAPRSSMQPYPLERRMHPRAHRVVRLPPVGLTSAQRRRTPYFPHLVALNEVGVEDERRLRESALDISSRRPLVAGVDATHFPQTV